MSRPADGCRTQARGRSSSVHAYTQDLMLWLRQAASLVAVFALSGSPAVLSACMAACLQAGPVALPIEQGASAAHAPRPAASSPAPDVASEHAHHSSSGSHQSSGDRQASPDSSTLSAVCGNCCGDGQTTVIDAVGVERTGAQRLAGASVPAPVPSYLTAIVARRASPPRTPPISPPSPARSSLVLRI